MSSGIPDDISAAYGAGRVPPDVSLAFLAESRDKSAEIGIWLILGLAAIMFALRTLVRLVIRPSPGIDDLLATGSLACYIAFAVLCQILLNLGSARHYAYIQYILPLPVVEETEILDFAAHLIYTTALYLCRMSGLAFYYYQIIGRSRSFTWTIRIVALTLTLAYVPQMLLIILHCMPVTALWPYEWQPGVEKYTCLQWGAVYATNSAISLVSDLALFTIPLAIILSLKRLSRSKRIKLAMVIMPGVGVIGLSVARLVLVVKGQWEPDESWYYGPMLAIECAEIGSTLIALSAPALLPLFRSWSRMAGRRLSLARSSGRPSAENPVITMGPGYYGPASRGNVAQRWWTDLRSGVLLEEAEEELSETDRSQRSRRLDQVNEEWSFHYCEKPGPVSTDEDLLSPPTSGTEDEDPSLKGSSKSSAATTPLSGHDWPILGSPDEHRRSPL